MGRKNRRKKLRPRQIRESRYIVGNPGYSKVGRATTILGAGAPIPDAGNPSKGTYTPRPRRGDIWFARLGNHYGTSVQAGTRPVLVISNDTGNYCSRTCTVLPMTTKLKKLNQPTHVPLSADSCVKTGDVDLLVSIVMAEQIVTIDRSALLEKIGFVADQGKLAEIERAVDIQLGIP